MGENGEDNQSGNYNYNITHNNLDPHVTLAGTSLVMGLASIPLGFFLNMGVITGGIAIVLALLSRGELSSLLPQAKKAVVYGILGVVIGYAVFAYDIYAVVTDPNARAQLNAVSEQVNGVSFDELLEQLGIETDG